MDPGGTEPGRNLTSKGISVVHSYPTQSNRAALEGFKVNANCQVGKIPCEELEPNGESRLKAPAVGQVLF